MPVYAAYGSNMDPKQMAQRAPHSPMRGTGWLQGWRLTFGGEDVGWEGALATIAESPAEHVFVVLYDVPDWDEPSLDQWEGAALGLYHKVKLRVATLDGEIVAWFYVLDGYEAACRRRATSASSPTPPRRPEPPTTTSPTSEAAPAPRSATDLQRSSIRTGSPDTVTVSPGRTGVVVPSSRRTSRALGPAVVAAVPVTAHLIEAV